MPIMQYDKNSRKKNPLTVINPNFKVGNSLIKNGNSQIKKFNLKVSFSKIKVRIINYAIWILKIIKMHNVTLLRFLSF